MNAGRYIVKTSSCDASELAKDSSLNPFGQGIEASNEPSSLSNNPPSTSATASMISSPKMGSCESPPPVIGRSDEEVRPGVYVMKSLFQEFSALANKKITHILATEPLEKPLSKCLQRGEDVSFDQLLAALGSVAEQSLPSLLRVLFAWREKQLSVSADFVEKKFPSPSSNSNTINSSAGSSMGIGGSATKGLPSSAPDSQSKASGKTTLDIAERAELVFLIEKRDLAIEFIFCLVLIEVLKQLSLHPGHDDLTTFIENLAFKHFRFRESAQADPNLANMNIISDLYAEVVGVLVQSRFQSVKKKFLFELDELRGKEQSNPLICHEIISLLMGMKFFRVKMVPIEEFEASFQFMHECAVYFLEVKDKDIKHALAGLFVEILVPVAAVVKNEVNVPCLKNFVELLYPPTLDLCTKKKHMLALFPLVTCLLCVSQKSFFLTNWHYFLVMCLSHLKNRDPKMCRVALESLYRLLWVYMIRIKCESNTATSSRLQSIVNSLFPKGSKTVVPRDTPLNIFVKIIQFIAQERLDFAMKEIVFDLLSVGRPVKFIMTPERMSIGLRAFLVVADSLQQKEGEPPMPRTVGVLPSGNTVRVKKTFLNKMLTDEVARNIGMNQYYPYVRKSLNDILRALDAQFGRPLMLTSVQNLTKEADSMTGEKKPKIDLFRTCIAAIPRLMPDGMTNEDLVNLLARLTLHMDEEIRGLACQALQNIVNDFKDWREDVIDGFVTFIMSEINDTFPGFLDNSLRMLLQLLTSWKNCLQSSPTSPVSISSPGSLTESAVCPTKLLRVMQHTEGLALAMLCSLRPQCRRISVLILKEIRSIAPTTLISNSDPRVIDILDEFCPVVIDANLTPCEKSAMSIISGNNLDIQTLVEKSSCSWATSSTSLGTSANLDWSAEIQQFQVGHSSRSASQDLSIRDEFKVNLWSNILMSLLVEVNKSCPSASSYAYNICCQRLTNVYSQLETSTSTSNLMSDRASVLLRGNSSLPKKSPSERNSSLFLWRSYLMMSCRLAPSTYQHDTPNTPFESLDQASSSPDAGANFMNHPHQDPPPQPTTPQQHQNFLTSFSSMRSSSSSVTIVKTSPSPLLHQVVPLIRSETSDIRSAAIVGLSFINSLALKDLMDELNPLVKEAIDRKQEKMNRKKRKDLLRLSLLKLMELLASRKTFSLSTVVDRDTSILTGLVLEYADGMRLFLESEPSVDKDFSTIAIDMKETFANFVTSLVESFPLEIRSLGLLSADLKKSLFVAFATWSGSFGKCLLRGDNYHFSRSTQRSLSTEQDLNPSSFEFNCLRSLCAILCCGPIFNPSLLSEDSHLYEFLELMLSSDDERISSLGHKTLVLLMEFNPDAGSLLDWVVDCCYTKPVKVADACFSSLATVFCLREYPCDHYIAIINVTLTNVGCPRLNIHQMALELLHVLDTRFFDTQAKDMLENEMTAGEGDSDDSDDNNEDRDDEETDVDESNFDEEHETDKEEESAAEDEQHIRVRRRAAFRRNRIRSIPKSPSKIDKKRRESATSPSKMSTFKPLLNESGLWTQPETSERMAFLHPHLTMAIFSDVTYRFQTARPAVCKILLQNLIPWLKNTVELVDPHANTCLTPSHTFDHGRQPHGQQECRDDGWGSPEATEMILNNLFYITIKFGDEYPTDIEKVWSALCCCFPNNVRVILRYLFIMTALAPNELITNTKKVATFVSRIQPEKFIDEITTELQTVESLNCVIERTETPPFYRLSIVRKNCGPSDEEFTTSGGATTSGEGGGKSTVINLEEGTLHTKRHSTEGGSGALANLAKHESRRSRVIPEQPTSLPQEDPSSIGEESLPCDEVKISNTLDDDSPSSSSGVSKQNVSQQNPVNQEKESTPHPHPPPMPEFGGFYAPLTKFLPNTNQPVVPVHRCHLALILLTDVVVDKNELDWSPHLPVILHVVFLGLDHSKPFVSLHCRQVLLNLLIRSLSYESYVAITKKLISTRSENLGLLWTSMSSSGLTITKNMGVPDFLSPPVKKCRQSIPPSRQGSIKTFSRSSHREDVTPYIKVSTAESSLKESLRKNHTNNSKLYSSPEDLTQLLIRFLSSLKNPTLWAYEDITAKVWDIRSADQLAFFLDHVVVALRFAYPNAKLTERWAEVSLQLALSCSSRHYAGRSLQIFRALKMPLNSRTLADILSRLVETAAEQGEDMQGYVTELMLTLESAVSCLDGNSSSTDVDFFARVGINAATMNIIGSRQSAPPSVLQQQMLMQQPHSLQFSSPKHHSLLLDQQHVRSTSVSFSGKESDKRPGHFRDRSQTDLRESPPTGPSLQSAMSGRMSKSVQSLKNDENDQFLLTSEDSVSLLAKLFWISIAMLETDYEHEFLLAVRLLDNILQRLPLDQLDVRDRVERVFRQLKWNNFSGLHSMLCKGCTSPNTYESTIILLHRLTPLLDISFIDPSETGNAFPFNVMSILPYMLANYDDPTTLCLSSAESFAKWATERTSKMENLATIMTLYNRRTFSKESFQWTKCVVKYLYDAYSHVFPRIIDFLVEVMDRGPQSIAIHTLSVLHCILHYVDINKPSNSMNTDLGKVISKYLDGNQWKDALKLIKLVVSRSSSLAAAPSVSTSNTMSASTMNINYMSLTSAMASADCVSLPSMPVSLTESDISSKTRELPGRTMDFYYNIDSAPIVAEKFLDATSNQPIMLSPMSDENHAFREQSSSPKKSLSHHPSFNESSTGANWKRPWISQARTRERLISLLTSFGQRVGLPKSPSVIFSQTSEGGRQTMEARERTEMATIGMDRQSSIASSTEDISAAVNNELTTMTDQASKFDVAGTEEDSAGPPDFSLFKDFDFLEYELESQDSEGMDNFNWGVRRRSLSNLEGAVGDGLEDVYSCSPLHDETLRHHRSRTDEVSSDEDISSASPFEGSGDLAVPGPHQHKHHLSLPPLHARNQSKGSEPSDEDKEANRPPSELSENSTPSHSEGDLSYSPQRL